MRVLTRFALPWTLALMLAACASAPVLRPVPAELFDDSLFTPPAAAVSAQAVFALSEPMRNYLQREIATQARSKGPQQGLIDALYTKGQLRLDYDASRTRNAAEAFDARSGNCLSLVIMTAAFARELGLRPRFQSALFEETWSRNGGLLLRSGHVNVTLGRPLADMRRDPLARQLTIDFLPPEQVAGVVMREVSEATIVAMYMNNRAAEHLVDGALDEAYAWARAAIEQDPSFIAGINTLGVIYARRGAIARAQQVFDLVLARQPDNLQGLANLAGLLERQGEAERAAALRSRQARLEPIPPFHYFLLGQAAMQRQEYEAAREYFRREAARNDDSADLHYWLALASFRLGQPELAQKHLGAALDHSASSAERARYGAKLAWLKALATKVPER
jgi:tetratricopeptide (TPR) repeat protein